MPITKEEFEAASERDLSKLAQEALNLLEEVGAKLGFRSDRNYPHAAGDLDLVWYLEIDLPGLELHRLPIVGFEIETSWRTRKHIKGDLFNLQKLHPALGIVILLEEGFEDEKKFRGLLQTTNRYARDEGFILVWTEEQLEKLKAIVESTKKSSPTNSVRALTGGN